MAKPGTIVVLVFFFVCLFFYLSARCHSLGQSYCLHMYGYLKYSRDQVSRVFGLENFFPGVHLEMCIWMCI